MISAFICCITIWCFINYFKNNKARKIQSCPHKSITKKALDFPKLEENENAFFLDKCVDCGAYVQTKITGYNRKGGENV